MFKYLVLSVCFGAVLSAENRDFLAEYEPARELLLNKCTEACKLNDLHRAVLLGNKEQIQKLVAEGVKIDEPAKHNWTAMEIDPLDG